MRSKYTGYRLNEIISDIRIAVSQIAGGQLKFDLPGQRPAMKMYAPSFRRGIKPQGASEAKAFTAVAIARHLGLTQGNRNSDRAAINVEVAFHLLEMQELGALDEPTLQEVCDGRWSLSELRKLFPVADLHEARETAAAAAVFPNPFLT